MTPMRNASRMPPDRRDAGRHAERVQLRARDADAERRRGALVRAHRDSRRPERPRRMLATISEQITKQRRGRRGRSGRVGDRVDVQAEQRGVADLRALRSRPCSRRLPNSISSIAVPRPSVTIARLMPRVRTAGTRRARRAGRSPATPTSSASQNGDPCGSTSRPATHAPKPADRELGERQLPGVAGDDDDRQQDDRRRTNVVMNESGHWLSRPRAGRRSPRRRSDAAPVDAAGADRRQPLQEVVAQRERLAGETSSHTTMR